MKKILIQAIITCITACAVSAQAGIISVFEGVKIRDGKRAEAMFYYNNNWKSFRVKALQKGYIHSFELFESSGDESAPFDILLITRYSNKDQQDKSEKRFRKLIDNSGGLKLLNDLKPSAFRKGIFVKIGKSTLDFPQTIKKSHRK